MKIPELFNSLTVSQRKEFDSDLKTIFTEFAAKKEILSGNEYQISSHMNLEDTIFLYVTIDFTVTHEAKVKGEIKTFKKFSDKDEYLESVRIEKLSQN